MKLRFLYQAILVAVLLCQLSVCLGKEAPESADPNRYLNAVREFADNVLKYGRDTYGPKHTPLFVDGLNIHTHEPVKWISPKGRDPFTAAETEEWILSNFASQQTLLRTLDGLSSLTGDPKYRDAAKQAIQYAFENLTAPNGLFYWGHYVAYDAQRDEVKYASSKSHILKVHYPYYELMWQVDPEATKRFIGSFWSAHVVDWSNLDFNRIAAYSQSLEEPWEHEYTDGPPFFNGKGGGGGFFNTGTSLAHAAATLHCLSGDEKPLMWSRRLIKRFVDTRHPATGMTKYMYNKLPFKVLGEDLADHFVDQRSFIFPSRIFAEVRNEYQPESVVPHQWMSILLTGDMLGERGKDFVRWASEELSAWGKVSYRRQGNSFTPVITDGTNIEGYILKEDCSIGDKGNVAVPLYTDLSFFWAYATAYRITGDDFMWQVAREICLGNKLGDIGQDNGEIPELEMDTTCSAVYGLLGFLQLYAKTKQPNLLRISRRIADNIVENKFHKGFFVPSQKHIYTRFDSFEPLALLRLVAAIESQPESVPTIWPSSPLFVPPYRYRQEGVDRRIIYTLTESPEVPLSLQEAAGTGDIDAVKSLIKKTVDVDRMDDSFRMTALQRAAIGGHKGIVELLLANGARIDVQRGWPSRTPLQWAAQKGHRQIVELLINKGANVNAKNEEGRTPLHIAALQGDAEIVESLLAHGGDVNAKDNRGITPLVLAQRRRRTDIVELLSKAAEDQKIAEEKKTEKEPDSSKDQSMESQKDEQSFEEAILSRDLARVKGLIAQGADVNIRDSRGNTPLLQAMIRRLSPVERLSLVKMLISAGADVNAKNRQGNTPLNLAMRRGYTEIVELLTKAAGEKTVVHDVAVTGVSAPTSCVQGDTVSIIVTLGNRGDSAQSCSVKLMDTTNDREIARQSATILSKHRVASDADLTFTGENQGDGFANQLGVGDMNGDGYADLYVGAAFWPRGDNTGRGYLYHGGSKMDNIPDKTFTGEHVGDRFSTSWLSHQDDINSDGFDDLIVAARFYNRETGRIYVFYGGTDMDEIPDIRIDPPASEGTGIRMGRALACGDINNDGEKDLVISAGNYDNLRGRAYLYYGPIASNVEPDKIFEGESPNQRFADSGISMGDVDGDGYDDLLLTTRYYPDVANVGDGRAYFYWGADGTSMDIIPDLIFTSEMRGDKLGTGSCLFDVDRDGYDDVLLGACAWGKGRGRTYIHWGCPRESFDMNADLTLTCEDAQSGFGNSSHVASVNNDACADLIINAYAWHDNSNQGRVYLFHGGPQDSMDNTYDCTFTGESPDFGAFSSRIADFNNDGHGDVAMGGMSHNESQGKVLLWYGPFDTTTDITFNWDTTKASLGKHTLKVEIPPVPGEQNTENNIKTVTVEVKERPGSVNKEQAR